MANREKGGRVVFIGNIPYGVSEEQICDIFGRTGQVLGFRLVYDKDSGQPKGFGFLEYADTDSAASAVRNLNDYELNGRTLRVDYSNDNRGVTRDNQNADSNRAPPPAHFNMGAAGQANGRTDGGALPPLPPGIELPPGVSALDSISQTLSNVPTPQLLDFISQLKHLCTTNPQQATALLAQAPQLGYAVFQALCLLGLVDPNIVQQLIATQQTAQPTPAPPQPQYQQPPPQPAFNQYGGPQQYTPQFAQTPSVQPAPTYQPPPQQPAPPPQVDPNDQAQLIQQVMSLTREQIYTMPNPARDQIIALRAQYGAPV